MRKVITGILATLALIVASAGIAAPAHAAPGCSSGWICFHNTSTSYPNESRDATDTSTGECHNFGSSAAATTSYITNRTGYRWYVYTSWSCLNWSATVYANTAGPMSGTWNNSIRSYKRG